MKMKCGYRGCPVDPFAEFCQGVTDSQLPQVAQAILPHLLKVIVQPQLFSVHTRTRAVHIYNILSGLIFTVETTDLVILSSFHLPILYDLLSFTFTLPTLALPPSLPPSLRILLRKCSSHHFKSTYMHLWTSLAMIFLTMA